MYIEKIIVFDQLHPGAKVYINLDFLSSSVYF